jgi:hypothetical protein
VSDRRSVNTKIPLSLLGVAAGFNEVQRVVVRCVERHPTAIDDIGSLRCDCNKIFREELCAVASFLLA